MSPCCSYSFGNALAQIALKFLVVELALAEKPERLGLHLHRADDLLVLELLVPLDVDAGDREVSSLVDVEGDVRIAVRGVDDRCDLGEVIALRLIHRVESW